MVQEVAEHERSRFVYHAWLCLEFTLAIIAALATTVRIVVVVQIRLLIHVVFGVFFVANGILTCLLVQVALHENIKEVGYRCIVSQLTVYVDGPEIGVRVRVLRIWEAQ